MKHVLALLLLASLAPTLRAGPVITPEAVESLPYTALGDEPPSRSEHPQFQLAPGGQAIATDDGQRVWLYARGSGQRLAVTPPVLPRQTYNGAGVVSVQGMRWTDDGTLTAWALLQDGGTEAYTADAGGAHGPSLPAPRWAPSDLAALLPQYGIAADPQVVYAFQADDSVVAWVQNRGHGELALYGARRGGAPHELATGSWELTTLPFDAQGSRVFHASAQGVVAQPLPGGEAALVAGTRPGDVPHAWDAASRWLLLLRPEGGCDAATAGSPDEYACLLRLPPVAGTPPTSTGAPAPGTGNARPSFDCTQARSTTEHLLCERAPLAALDVHLSGLYRQALARSANPSALKKQQLDWLRERDRGCTVGRTLAEARSDTAVDGCLRDHYAARIRRLRAQVAPDIQLTGVQALPPATLQGTHFGEAGCDAAQALFADSGQALALEMDCLQAGRGRRFFLLELAGQRAVAASPWLGASGSRNETVSRTGADLIWLDPILYISTSGPDPSGQVAAPGQAVPLQFAASLQPLPTGRSLGAPAALQEQRATRAAAWDAAQAQGDPGLLAKTALQLGPHLVWLSDQGRGRVILRDHRQDTPGRLDLHHGGWELLRLLHDEHDLIYASDDGLMMLDFASAHGARRIAQTAAGDVPLAWNPSTRELAWTSPRLCGLEQGGDTLGPQLCTAVLDSEVEN